MDHPISFMRNLFGKTNPSPAYLYRRYLTKQLLHKLSPGRFLEIGVGSGKVYEELVSRGFRGLCLDLNPEVIRRHQLERSMADDRVQFRSQDFFSLEEQFDLILSFEVLEHYQEDQICLRKWRSLLRSKGVLIFSVPAHMRHWTENDTLAGHARRYEKSELLEKVSTEGFRIEEFWCYGFPVLNCTYPVSIFFKRRAKERDQVGPASLLSGVFMADSASTATSGGRPFLVLSEFMFVEPLWWPFLQLQKPFLRKDWGTGYIVKCRTG